MEFIKKNYEKLILGLVLLLLVAAAVFIIFFISEHRAAMLRLQDDVSNPKVTELEAVNTAEPDAAFQRTQYPVHLDFTGNNHNTFNPVTWKKMPDGKLLKLTSELHEGPDALVVTNIKKLYLIISYNSPSASGYLLNIERQTMKSEGKRKTQNFVSLQTKSELLTLLEVKGPADNPTELDLEWNETGEKIAVTPDKSFQRVDGYSADLKYPLETGKSWQDRRVGSTLNFANANYNIVAITESNVVVSAQSNQKKTTISFTPRN